MHPYCDSAGRLGQNFPVSLSRREPTDATRAGGLIPVQRWAQRAFTIRAMTTMAAANNAMNLSRRKKLAGEVSPPKILSAQLGPLGSLSSSSCCIMSFFGRDR